MLAAAPIPLPIGVPLSWLYRAGMWMHSGVRRRMRERLGIPVVSVGNLSVGGTGKTPMVIHLAARLVREGYRPCVAMRGYAGGRSSREGGRVGSDEAAVYQRAFERMGIDVPVVARPDRAVGVRELLARRGDVSVALLDDGFQHHRLARDLDIVLVDASRSPFEDRLLPAGWLREPVGALRRAGAVVVTHAEAVSDAALVELERQIEATHGSAAIGVARHEWTGLEVSDGAGALMAPVADRGHGHREPVEWLRGRRVLVVCAIGNPEAFVREAARRIGQEPAGVVTLRDHDPYSDATVERVVAASRGMSAVLTTEKDWVKLRRVEAGKWACPVARPRLEMVMVRGGEELVGRVMEVIEP